MNYPCGIIKDLLPLYIDDVCNEESRTAVEIHLSECENCRNYYASMKSQEGFILKNIDNSEDMKMADSLKKAKGKILKRVIIASVVSALAVIGIFSLVSVLQTKECVIDYDDNITIIDTLPENISVQVVGYDTLYKCQSIVKTDAGDDTENRIYFYLSTSKWDALFPGKRELSMSLLRPLHKDTDIDKIYYYVGDYSNLENVMTESELAEIDAQATLLWSK